jgi:hypothetical protein
LSLNLLTLMPLYCSILSFLLDEFSFSYGKIERGWLR